MEPLALHDRVAHDVLQVVLLAWVVSEIVLRSRGRGARHPFDWSLIVVAACIGGAVAAAFRADHVRTTVLGGGWAPFVVGLALIAAGGSLRGWAILSLGRFFTSQVAVQEGHRVVRSGPYRLLRHPAYTGLLVGLLGLGIALDDWLSILVLALLPLAGLVIRIRHEEAVLTAALGQEYRDYAAETPRLIPGLW